MQTKFRKNVRFAGNFLSMDICSELDFGRVDTDYSYNL